jgi:hypothetical protein
MRVIQGTREFGVINSRTGVTIGYVYKEDGEHYFGKSFDYHLCPICAHFICHMFGGSQRHYTACKRKKQNLELDIQMLHDKENWSGLSYEERQKVNELQTQYQILTGKKFSPQYNCPA